MYEGGRIGYDATTALYSLIMGGGQNQVKVHV